MIEINSRIAIPDEEISMEFIRASGPGGQNVNKVETKAELRVGVEDLPIPGRAKARLRTIAGRRIIGAEEFVDEEGRARVRGGERVITSDSERTQSRNKAECLERLREMLVVALAEPKVRRKTRPTRGSVERRIGEKKKRGEIKKGRRDGGE